MLAPVLYDHNILPVFASSAYKGPFEATDQANITPLVKETGPSAKSLLGFAVVHKISPVCTSKAAQPPAVVVWLDGASLNGK